MVMLAAAVAVVPRRGKADDVDPVLVVNGPKRPVPVTGNVAIGGTANVNVTNQPTVSLAAGTSVGVNGTVNANVTNTPNVNVTGLPAVQLAQGTVVGTVNASAVQPMQATVTVHLDAGTNFGALDAFSVPPGKRFVLEEFSGGVDLPAGEKAIFARVELAQQLVFVFSPVSFGGTDTMGRDTFQWNQLCRADANPGERLRVLIVRDSLTGDGIGVLTVSGYLVDLP
jgi:hypothetical protein